MVFGGSESSNSVQRSARKATAEVTVGAKTTAVLERAFGDSECSRGAGRDSSVVRALDLWFKGPGFKSLQ